MSAPITFITWKWRPAPGYRSSYTAEAVHVLRAMIARHYAAPHRFVCITDDPAGLEGLETWPLWPDHAGIPNPHGRHLPSCYRRLRLFAPEAREWFGERLVSMDLDTVIVADLAPLFDRPEPFVIWGQTDFPGRQWYNGSLWYLVAGSRAIVWSAFDPVHSPRQAARAGHRGSDQGWLSYVLGPREAVWTTAEGVYSYRVHIAPEGDRLPDNARVICFHGRVDPWSAAAQRAAWVRRHYAA